MDYFKLLLDIQKSVINYYQVDYLKLLLDIFRNLLLIIIKMDYLKLHFSPSF